MDYIDSVICPSPVDSNIYVSEKITHFYHRMSLRYRGLTGSEFLPNAKPGEMHQYGDTVVMNQDLTNLSFEENQFDVVVSQDIFEHIADYKKAFQECYRVIKKGGTLVFTIPFFTNNIKR